MSTYNDILEELSSMNSPLAGMSRHMPYQLPEGYFDQLAAQVVTSVSARDITTLEDGTKQMPFALPENYFDQLQTNILAQVQQESVTDNLPKDNVFTTPEGYFDTLPAQIMAKLHAETTLPAKRTRTISWQNLRWAAAAVVVLGLGIGAVKMFGPGAGNEPGVTQIPQTAINAYVQQNIDEFDAELLENNIAANINLHTQPALLNTVDQNDIIQYLNENGWEEPATTN